MKLFSPIRRFFHTMVMLHKIAFVRHFNHARKRKGWRTYYINRRAYGLTILPNLVLLLGMVCATAPRKEEVAASLSQSNDFPDEIQGVLRYCVGGSIQADSLDMERARGIHAHSILPLLAELAHALNGSGEAERMADGAGYCDVRYYLDVCGTATDFPKAGDTWITVDILSFDDDNPDIKRCLNALRGKEYLAVETAPEAPEQCLVFTEGGKLIAVWCSLFRDGQEVVEKVKERLETFIVD